MRGARAAVLAGVLGLVSTTAHAAPTEATWVFFDDKGLSSQEQELALALRQAQLSPKALARRVRERGDAGVDERDLRVSPAYVERVLAVGATLRTESRWLNAISVEITPAQKRQIAALEFVTGLEPVARAERREPSALTGPAFPAADEDYGAAFEQLEMVGVPALHECGLDGSGVLVGVLDTGFLLEHQAFDDLDVVDAYDFINDDDVVENEQGDSGGQHNHGSWVLALMAGDDVGNYLAPAPRASVLLAKTEDVSQEEPIEEDWFVEGLEWIEAAGADIATASLGYYAWYQPEDFDGQTAVTSQAAAVAIQNGLIVFVAMGNFGPDPSTLLVPADTEGVISVGAVKLDGVIAGFSSRGPTADDRIKPEVVAPGAGVSTIRISTTDEYGTGNGTSFATPIAAGTGALLKQAYPLLGPAEMLDLLRSTANNADDPNNDYGWGLIDGAAAGELYCTCDDLDQDGYFDDLCGGTDCDDEDEAINPAGDEVCNGADDDCDGELAGDEVDGDEDGVMVCEGDCDDARDDVYPEHEEICDDGVDNDCNDLADDEDPACMTSETGTETGTDTGAGDEGQGGDTGGDGTGTDDGGTDGAGAGDGPGRGCGCAQSGRGPGSGWLLGLLLLSRRRGPRRRRPASIIPNYGS